MILVLVGFMGCGKSSLLEHWQQEYLGASADLDHLVASRVGVLPKDLGSWIRREGFEKFRALESQILKEVITKNKNYLLALGGGAFHKKNREILEARPAVEALWIETPIDECWQRVRGDTNRPLVAEGEVAFKELYQQRVSDYRHAKYRLSGEGTWPGFGEFCKKYNISSIIPD